jgi:lipopolysaccharide export system permease protein
VSILKRYIFVEVLIATIGAMLMFCLILVAGNVLRELATRLADGRLQFSVFAQLIGLLIPFVFSFSLPLGFLTGILIGLGRLSSSREIIAMKATGSGMMTIASPVFLMAILGALLAGWTNNYLAPLSRTAYKSLMVEALREDPLRFFETGVLSREFPGYIFFIQEKREDELRGFWLWELDTEDRPSFFVRADRGMIDYERERDALILTLENGVAEQWPKPGAELSPIESASVYFEEFPIELPLSYSLGAAKVKRDLSEFSLSELLEMLKGDRPLPETEKGNPQEIRNRIRIQISNNASLAASLIALATVGIPLAIRTGRKETYANAMLALGLGLVYYFFVSMIASLDIPSRYHPEWLVWVPNLVMMGIGCALILRIRQH